MVDIIEPLVFPVLFFFKWQTTILVKRTINQRRWISIKMREKKTYVLEFHSNQSMDFQCNQANKYIMVNDLQRNIQHLMNKRQRMDQHIFDWNKILSADNRYSLHTLDDIQYMDHRNIQASNYMHQHYFFHGIQHWFHMDSLDKQSLLAHDKLKTMATQIEWISDFKTTNDMRLQWITNGMFPEQQKKLFDLKKCIFQIDLIIVFSFSCCSE